MEAAEAAGISDRTARVAGPLARGGTGGPVRPLLGAATDPAQDAAERVAAIVRLRRLRMTGGADRRAPSDGALDGLGGPQARGLGKRSRLSRPSRANRYERRRAGRADPHRRQEARPDPGARPPRHRQPRGQRPHRNGRRRRRRLGVRPRRVDDHKPPGLRRGPRRREGDDRGRLPAARRGVLRRLRHHG